MKRLGTYLLCLLVLLLGSCARKEILPERTALLLRLKLSSQAVVKGSVGDVSAPEEERTLTSLRVWVFRHSDGLALGYLEPNVEDFDDGDEEHLFLLLDNDIAKTRPVVDVYAVANLEGTGLSLSSHATRDQLDAAVISGHFFGNNTSTIPDAGLPYSGVGMRELVGNFPVLTTGPLSLTRSVSKLRFVFGQMAGADGVTPVDNFVITGISLDGDLFPTQEYLFNTGNQTYRVNNTYESAPVVFPVPTGTIPACPKPEIYAYSGQNAVAYDNLISQALTQGKVSATPCYYFRETPEILKGTISYTIGGVPGSARYVMSTAGDFARNRSWTVYVYFTSGRVNFSVSYTPWENGGDIPMNGDHV